MLEEAAFVDAKVFRTVVGPMLMVAHATLIGISTAQDGFNYYSQLLDLIDPRTNEPRFRVVKVGLACDACTEKNLAAQCEHRTSRLPPWQTVSRRRMLQGIMGSDTAAFAREAMGMVASSDHFVYKSYMDALLKQPRVSFTQRPGAVYFAVDPSGGGSASDYALLITTFHDGHHVVSRACVRCTSRMWCTNARKLENWTSVTRSTAWRSERVPHSRCMKACDKYVRKGWKSSGGVREPT